MHCKEKTGPVTHTYNASQIELSWREFSKRTISWNRRELARGKD
jgi:hypothetical protein